MRNSESLIEHIRSWRTKSDQVNYALRDGFSLRLAQLKRLFYSGTMFNLLRKLMFSKRQCLIYKLNIGDVGHSKGIENNFRTKKISVIKAIEFICQLHRCNSPAIWGDLLRRELQGAECYGAFIDGRLIHTSWVTDQKNVIISEIGESLELEDGECCIFDCNTLAEYRGREAYTQTLMYITHVKTTSGYSSIYIYSLSSNISSIRGIEKAGFDLTEISKERLME